MKILISGANGMLGQMLAKVLEDHELVLTDREEMDITDADKTKQVITHEKPDYIIHAAAYVNVDQAEDEVELCRKINVDGSENIARAAKDTGARLFYISTDYVFDGTNNKPYTETDQTNPLGVYAKSKLDGEVEIAKFCPEHFILRVAWLFGESSSNKNFVETMINLSTQRSELKVINDQIGSPTYTLDLAEIIKIMIEKNLPYGVYHFSGEGETTRFGFTKKIFDLLKISTPLKPIATEDFPAKAQRPKYSYLSKSKIKNTLQIDIRTWQEMLEDYFEHTKN